MSPCRNYRPRSCGRAVEVHARSHVQKLCGEIKTQHAYLPLHYLRVTKSRRQNTSLLAIVFCRRHPNVGRRGEQDGHGFTRAFKTCTTTILLQHNGASFHPLMTSHTHTHTELMTSKDSSSLITTLPLSRGGGIIRASVHVPWKFTQILPKGTSACLDLLRRNAAVKIAIGTPRLVPKGFHTLAWFLFRFHLLWAEPYCFT